MGVYFRMHVPFQNKTILIQKCVFKATGYPCACMYACVHRYQKLKVFLFFFPRTWLINVVKEVNNWGGSKKSGTGARVRRKEGQMDWASGWVGQQNEDSTRNNLRNVRCPTFMDARSMQSSLTCVNVLQVLSGDSKSSSPARQSVKQRVSDSRSPELSPPSGLFLWISVTLKQKSVTQRTKTSLRKWTSSTNVLKGVFHHFISSICQ